MFVPAGESVEYGAAGRDVSPYGEWRWTPMGLAGRDPIFHAQLESEMRLIAQGFRLRPEARGRGLRETLADTCLKCHGAMGKRQFDIDHRARRRSSRSTTFMRSPVPTSTRATATPGTARWPATASVAWSATACSREPQPADDHRPYLAVLPGDVDHRQLPPRRAGRDLRPVRGRRDRPLRHGARHRPEAEARRFPEVVAALRDVPHGRPADRRSAAATPRIRTSPTS